MTTLLGVELAGRPVLVVGGGPVAARRAQALLADVARPAIRDVAFSAYFTLMFGVGAIWAAALGALVGTLGDRAGFPVAFGISALSYLGAALVVTRIRTPSRRARAAGTP